MLSGLKGPSHYAQARSYLVKKQRCPVAGKVTVGLESHWPCVIDLTGLSTYGLEAEAICSLLLNRLKAATPLTLRLT